LEFGNSIFNGLERLRDPFCTSVPNFRTIGETNRFRDIAIFVIFQGDGRRHRGFFKLENLTVSPLQGANLCQHAI